MSTRTASGAKTLPGKYYTSEEIFLLESKNIFTKQWLYAGRISQLKKVGSYFLFNIDNESIIILRDQNDEVKAYYNVCRHRGTRLCSDSEGEFSKTIQCPYHAWTYDLEGNLKGAPQVMDTIDISKYPLRCVKLENFHGMLFINFDENAVFEPIAADLHTPLAPYDIANTKVAHRQNYPIKSNWKLAVENFCECYHCIPAHPEFSVGHGGARPSAQVAD
ncbi:aromatic ring-hydroxylating dioxygenase subunit alpha, partial [candidate division KSB1 bacterium]|nr:aromatic ring-hydroxylating dioxygenase subunit alpha [candidate division KSB1 bacterium]